MDITVFKALLYTTFTAFIAAITSVFHIMAIMAVMFIADLFFGIVAGWITQGEGLKWKKLLIALSSVVIYGSIVALAQVIGVLMKSEIGADYSVNIITLIYIYFIGTNTLKNLSRIFPHVKLFKALYWLLSLKFAEKLPDLYNKLKEKGEIEE